MISYTPRARGDLSAIKEWISRDDPVAADRVASRIVEALRRLETFPASGRMTDMAGVRELVVPGLPYIVRYRIRPGGVQVLAVWHGRQRRD